MAFRIGVQHTPGLASLGNRVRDALPALWPGRVRFVPLAQRPVPQAAYDTAQRHVDVRFLLDATRMPLPPGCDALLWLVGENIGDCWRPWVLGAAVPGRAVVSTFRLSDPLDVLKNTAHEVGHLLGLPHCEGLCCMRPVRHESQLVALPLALCRTCQNRLSAMRGETLPGGGAA